MNSSKPRSIVVAEHPSVVTRDIMTAYSALATNLTEKEAIESIVSMTLPPPNINVLSEAVDILSN